MKSPKQQTLKVLYNGKIRTRILGKPRHFNKVRWMIEDGMSIKEIRKTLFDKRTESIRRRLHGKKRQQNIASKKGQVKKAIEANIVYMQLKANDL